MEGFQISFQKTPFIRPCIIFLEGPLSWPYQLFLESLLPISSVHYPEGSLSIVACDPRCARHHSLPTQPVLDQALLIHTPRSKTPKGQLVVLEDLLLVLKNLLLVLESLLVVSKVLVRDQTFSLNTLSYLLQHSICKASLPETFD